MWSSRSGGGEWDGGMGLCASMHKRINSKYIHTHVRDYTSYITTFMYTYSSLIIITIPAAFRSCPERV